MLLNLTFGELLAVFAAISALTTALYLLDRNRRKRVVSTLRFWVTPGLPSPVTRRRKIQQPLSLVLQLAGMLLLLLALAEMRWGGIGRARRDHVLIIDTSAWMTASAPGRPNATLMDVARASAISWLRAVPDSDRVILVRADALATPATSWETDHVKIARAILETKPGATAIDLAQSLEFARQLQKNSGSSGGEIVYDGPGRIGAAEAEAGAPKDLPLLRYLQVSDPAENAGLRSVGARRSASSPNTWDLLVRVRNYGRTAKKVNVTVNLAHAPVGMNALTLAPGTEQDTSFAIHTKAAGLAEIRLYPEDPFAADNYAALELPAQPSLHVVVYTDAPQQWEPALASDPRISAEFRRPRDFTEAQKNDGLVILDRFHPAQVPPGSTLWIDPPEKSPIPVREHVADPAGLQWASDQPLAAGLRQHDLRIPSTAILEPGAGDIRVAQVDKGTVIAARESADGKTRTIVMGFSPFEGSLRYELAAPLLLANELRWFAPDVFRDVDVTARSAGSVDDVLANPRATDVQVITDAGTNLPFSIRDGKIHFFSGSAARVSVVSANSERVYSLTLPEMWDQRWVPPAGVRRGIPAWNDAIRRSTDLWPWLAVFGAAVLLLEYLLYGREMSALLRVVRAHMEKAGQSVSGRSEEQGGRAA
jgi:hypothetical protein